MLKKIAKINTVVLVMVLICLAFSQTGQGYISNDLSLDQQLSLRGGTCDDDCKTIGQNCLTNITCDNDDQCNAGTYICNDHSQEENCKTPGSWPECLYDPAHTCNPKKMLSGFCGGECGVDSPGYGNCDGGTWIRQCHY